MYDVIINLGDTIEAIEGSVSAIFSEGRQGEVVGLPPHSNNRLVRWGDESIFMGFHLEDVRVVRRARSE